MTPSFDEREPRRGSSLSYQPLVPIGAGPGHGPEYDPEIGHPVVQPPAVTHLHAYSPPSPMGESVPRTDRESDPLPHAFGAPTQSQYHPSEHIEQYPVPTGRAPSSCRSSPALSVVEFTGHPERTHVHSPDHPQPRTASSGKFCNICTTHLTN